MSENPRVTLHIGTLGSVQEVVCMMGGVRVPRGIDWPTQDAGWRPKVPSRTGKPVSL